MVHYIKKLGKGVGKLFAPEKEPARVDATHSLFSYGFVYANAPARAEIEKENPQFPPGAIIVREKRATAASETPETVIAMVKREPGFSRQTADWEFFTFNGTDLKLQKRETKGDCAACHAGAKKTDWIFRDYLK